MTYVVVMAVAFIASGLTFFSGFGLGTLLLPAFALFFPAERAVALTAVVHILNGLFKLGLVARYANLAVVLRFGAPAILASLLGATLLVWLSGTEPLATYQILGRVAQVTSVKLVVGGLLLLFGLADLLPATQGLSFSPRYLPLGGALRLLRRPVGDAGRAAVSLSGEGGPVEGVLHRHRRPGGGTDRHLAAWRLRPGTTA